MKRKRRSNQVVRWACAIGLAVACACSTSNGPQADPSIAQFSISRDGVGAGDEVVLNWEVHDASSLRLDPNVGDVTGQSQARVRVSQNTSFVLTASRGDKSVQATRNVAVLHFEWSGLPSEVAAGTAYVAALSVKDSNGSRFAYSGTVHFSSTDAMAQLPADYRFKDADQGQASFTIALRTRPGQQTVTARDVDVSSISGSASTQVIASLVYTDPLGGGKIRLIKDPASTPTSVVLKLVSAENLSGYSVGLNLPIDAAKVKANALLITPGDALIAGDAPQALQAVIPSSGPLKGVLATGLSQKASGAGAVPSDTSISPGKTFYTIRLDVAPAAELGTVFDGSAPGAKFAAALINKSGDDTVRQADFAIGKLEAF